MATPIVMPRLGDFMTEGRVVRLAKSQGDDVGQGEVLAEIETEKLNYDLESVAGGLFHPLVEEGATVAVDGLIGYVLDEGEQPPAPEAAQTATRTRAAAPRRRRQPARRQSGDAPRSTPGARRAAAELGVDIASVSPSGARGRIVEADVRAFAEAQTRAASAAAMPPGLPQPTSGEPLSGMRRSIARHMTDSLRSSAQLSYFLEVDVSDAQAMRREASRAEDTTITLAHVLIKACADTLARFPTMNAALVDGALYTFEQINMGVAVALDDGLIVPVLRDVGSMDIRQISDAVHSLSLRARDGSLSPDEVVGGTFTISVLGGVDGFTPILNQPQAGILGVGRSVRKPVVARGEIAIREMMTLSLTADHQVIDGAVAASFMRRLQASVERPARLFR